MTTEVESLNAVRGILVAQGILATRESRDAEAWNASVTSERCKCSYNASTAGVWLSHGLILLSTAIEASPL